MANSARSTASELKSSESPGGGSTGGNDVRGELTRLTSPLYGNSVVIVNDNGVFIYNIIYIYRSYIYI